MTGKKMRGLCWKRLLNILCSIGAITATGCGDLVVQSGPEGMLPAADPADGEVPGIVLSASKLGAEGVASLAYTITAVDMDTLRGELPVGGGDTISGTVVGVKEGPDRRVRLDAYDADGIGTHTGWATVDVVAGTTVSVEIALRPLTPDGGPADTTGTGDEPNGGVVDPEGLSPRERAERLLGFWRFNFTVSGEDFSAQYHLQSIGEAGQSGEFAVRGVSKNGDAVVAAFDPDSGHYRLVHVTDAVRINVVFAINGESATGEIRFAYRPSASEDFDEETVYNLHLSSGRTSGF